MISANFADVATWMCVADLRLFVTLRSIALLGGVCLAGRVRQPPKRQPNRTASAGDHADESEWFADAPRRLLRASWRTGCRNDESADCETKREGPPSRESGPSQNTRNETISEIKL